MTKPAIKQDLSYTMILKSVGNPNYGQYAPISNELTITAKNIKGLIVQCSEYIDKYDLGGGNWPNPEILHPINGNIGYISYNGRAWHKQGSEILGELLTKSL
jgi:hypothetical protein